MEVKMLRILAPIILLSVILPTVDVGSDFNLIYEFFSGGMATCSVPTDGCFKNTDYLEGLSCEEQAQVHDLECRKFTVCYCSSHPEHCDFHQDFGCMLLGK